MVERRVSQRKTRSTTPGRANDRSEEIEEDATSPGASPREHRSGRAFLEKNYSGTGWTRRTQGQSLWHRASVLAKPAATMGALSGSPPAKKKGGPSALDKLKGVVTKEKVVTGMKVTIVAILGLLLLALLGQALSNAFDSADAPIVGKDGEVGAAQLLQLEKRMQGKLSTSEQAILGKLKGLEDKVEDLKGLSKLKSKLDVLGQLADKASSIFKAAELTPELQQLQERVDGIAAISARVDEVAGADKAFASAKDVEDVKQTMELVVEMVEGQEKNIEKTLESWKGKAGTSKKHILDELEKFAADRTGRVDFAAYTGELSQAHVVEHSTLSKLVLGTPSTFLYSLFGKPAVHDRASEWLLGPGLETPGDCLALNGTSGYVDVRLREPVRPDAITLEHIPKSIAYNEGSAPKSFSVFGSSGAPPSEAAEAQPPALVHLMDGEYDLDGTPVQTFPLNRAPKAPVDYVRLQVTSNHGHDEYTCIYRLRVHGTA